MVIEHYSFGRIVIDGRTYTSDVIVFPDRVLSHWWRKEGHLLQAEDLTEVIQAKPEILIIGKGDSGVMEVPGTVIIELRERGIDVIAATTPEAVRIYNQTEGKRKIAALHLTC